MNEEEILQELNDHLPYDYCRSEGTESNTYQEWIDEDSWQFQLKLLVENKNKEIERLNNKYNKALELLSDYNLPCEYDEGKIPDNYCEENCSDDYKKCWNKYIELELKGDSSNE